jgi:hypothetical protein
MCPEIVVKFNNNVLFYNPFTLFTIY